MHDVRSTTQRWKKGSVGCAAALALAVTGCHPKTKPTPENFTAAINAYYLERPECLLPDAPRFPFETSDPEKTRQMNTLVKSQLLTVETEPSIHASRYTPTTIGGRAAPRFCYGHRQVSAIDSSTPPAQANGFPETRVSYHYEMKDVPVWAKSPDVQAAFPKMAADVAGEPSATITLAGTMAGWQVPD